MASKNIKLKALSAACALFISDFALSAMVLEEVVVTAQRRSENQQDVPLAITSVSGEALEAKGLNDVASIGGITPNATLKSSASFGGSGSILVSYIRGIGQNDFAFNLEPGVGIYIDGAYLARNIGANVDLLDIQNIEVLKGPQGTLFGRNSIGGALNITTRDPGYEFGGKGEVTTGKFGRLDVRGTVDIPLVADELTMGVAFSSKNRDGWQKRIPYDGDRGNHPFLGGLDAGAVYGNTDGAQLFPITDPATPSESGDQDSYSIRTKLLWEPTERFTARLIGDYQDVDQGAAPFSLMSVNPQAAYVGIYNACITGIPDVIAAVDAGAAAAGAGAPGGVTSLCNSVRGNPGSPTGTQPSLVSEAGQHLPYDNRYVTGDPDVSYASGANYDKLESWGINLTLDYQLSDTMSLKSITTYRELESAFGVDIGGAPFSALNPTFADDQEQWSQEFHLSGVAWNDRWNYLIGAYFFHEEGLHDDAVPFTAGLIQIYSPDFDYETDAQAIFMHNNIALTEKLGLTFGIRYTEEDKSLIGTQRDENAFAQQLVQLPAFVFPDPNDIYLLYPQGENEQDFDDVSYRIGFEYSFNDDLMVYTSFATGYKGGGWTTRVTAPLFDLNTFERLGAPTFDPEEAETFEVGIKSELFDGRARLNAAAFMTNYDDMQLTFQDGTSPVTANGGDGEIKGVETELEAVLTDNWSVDASLGYIKAEYVSTRPGVLLTGAEDFVNTPEWTAHIGSSYQVNTDMGTVTPRIDWMFQTETYNDEANTPILRSSSYGIINASVNFETHDSGWAVQAGVTNLTDKREIVSGYTNGEAIYAATFNRPREWYLTLRKTF